ncbi:MAG: SMC-Scp complex subunit ScpB [Planctomycetota bacterium]|nr:MAG: SMC-Scp complex subunit ScpB [Planctomycetota bacterium]
MTDEQDGQEKRNEIPALGDSADSSEPRKDLPAGGETPTAPASGPFADPDKPIHFDPEKIDSVISDREEVRAKEREAAAGEVPPEPPVTVEQLPNILEALLFASGTEPLSVRKLAHLLPGIEGKTVRKALNKLAEEYSTSKRGIQLEEVAGGFQLFTNMEYYQYLKKLKRAPRPIRLSSASMQVLALVAWKQPVIKADVDTIRGTDCGQILRNLIELGLLEMSGRAEVIGKPYLYSTTRQFLEVFGMRSLDDLPKIEDLAVED